MKKKYAHSLFEMWIGISADTFYLQSSMFSVPRIDAWYSQNLVITSQLPVTSHNSINTLNPQTWINLKIEMHLINHLTKFKLFFNVIYQIQLSPPTRHRIIILLLSTMKLFKKKKKNLWHISISMLIGIFFEFMQIYFTVCLNVWIFYDHWPVDR